MTAAKRPARVAAAPEVIRNGLMVIGPDRPRLIASALLALLVGIVETGILYIIAAIAIAMSGGGAVRLGPAGMGFEVSIATACHIGLAVVVVLLALSFPLAKLLASLSSRAMVRLRGRMLRAYLSASLHYRDTHREGLLQQLIGEYAMRAENSVQQLALALVTICMFAAVLAGAIISSPVIALGMVGGLALCGALLFPIIRRMRQDATKPILTNREVVGRVAQATRTSQEISAFHVARPVIDMLARDIAIAAEAMRKLRFEGRLVPSLFQYGAIGIVLLLVLVLSGSGTGHLEGLAPLALLLVRALTYVRQLQRAMHVAREMAPYITSIEEEVSALEENAWPEGDREIADFRELRFDHVDYAYKPGERVLKDVSFAIRQGEMVGIVGPSGSGKSTLSGLILRLRSAASGTIAVDDVPLERATAESWARLSAFVPQDSHLIYGTVYQNIRFFRDGYDDETVIAAAKGAHLHDEIMRLPEGYDTLIGPGARGLSGGQRQRLAIARALLARPKLIVMDEPTSALDRNSELMVGQTLEELKGHTTIVLIAHRPATLGICDRIFRVEHGVLTETPVSQHVA
ncbi:ABC transporter ATP-binding protein [Stakelama tenebrarum]|uniref:ABC transporter ATP-binding protein n=1 Tax=Stakelama tenebrarum TaxID=2711215 RepID=A0A6G6Y3R1_9SPHN|nr:ABC transporter ATP-binding protein [Sphingosinithalassobacter tenebrarum]QIG79540.1 ABC transporter ATP-binding protein [Sphingosinithalassobacter tenebrarum]